MNPSLFDFASKKQITSSDSRPLLICFSHLRWDFVFQRPQHLMTRFARDHRVIFWEEPIADSDAAARLDVRQCKQSGVTIVTPHGPPGLDGSELDRGVKALVDKFLTGNRAPLIRWYYTPMMLPISRHLEAVCTIYDCMDELANFRFAPPELLSLEAELFGRADLVFTGGYSLYEAKRARHPDVHPFPSSVDAAHFRAARARRRDPEDQRALPRPRLGFYGVIDERIDLALLAAVADARPDWTLVMVGPVVKIDPAELPQRANIAWLGSKTYDELPAYLSGWDVALMPFAINESTKYTSPTKTP